MNTSIQTRVPRCGGACNQGRAPCPVPAACENPEPMTNSDMLWVYGLMAAPFVVAILAAVVIWFTLH